MPRFFILKIAEKGIEMSSTLAKCVFARLFPHILLWK